MPLNESERSELNFLEELSSKNPAQATNDPSLEQGADLTTRAVVSNAPNLESMIQTLQNRGATDIQQAGTDSFGNPNFIFTDANGKRVLFNPAGEFDVGDLAELSRMGVTSVISGMAALAATPGGPGAMALAAGGAEAGAGFLFDKAAGFLGQADTRTNLEAATQRTVEGGLAAVGQRVGPAIGRGVKGLVGGVARGGRAGIERGARAVSALQRVGIDEPGSTGIIARIRGLDPFGRDVQPSLSLGATSGTRFVQGLEGILSKFPGASGRFQKVARKTNSKIAEFSENLQATLSRSSGVDPEKAGLTIKKGFDQFLDNGTQRANVLFGDLKKLIPPDTQTGALNTFSLISEITEAIPGEGGIEVVESLSPGFTRVAGSVVELFKKNNGNLNYGQLEGVRKIVGNKLGSKDLILSDIPRADLKRLYGAITQDMLEVAEGLGPQAVRQFKRSNRFWNAFITRVDDFVAPILKKDTPEQMFKAAIGGTVDGPTRIRAIRKSLTTDQFDVLVAATLKKFGRTKGFQGVAEEAAEEAGDLFSINTFLTNWINTDNKAKDVMFNTTSLKGLRKDLDAIAEIGSRIRQAGRVFQNASGTAAATAGTGLMFAAGGGAASFAGGQGFSPGFLIGLGLFATSGNAAARLLTSQRVVRWFAQGMKMKSGGISSHIGRLAGIAQGEDSETRAAISELLGAIGAVDDGREVPTTTRISRSRSRVRQGRRGPQRLRPGILTNQ